MVRTHHPPQFLCPSDHVGGDIRTTRRFGRCVASLVLVGAVITVFPFAGLSAVAEPSARAVSNAAPAPPTLAQCIARFGSTCLTPQLLREVYGVDKLIGSGITGVGVTVAIVDSFGSPTLAEDLQVFNEAFGLPPVDLEIVTPVGAPPPFNARDSDMAGWALETTLDVEIVHAIAPGAKILVIVTPTSETEGLQGFPEIVAAEKAVLGRIDVLSQSFAATEPTFDSADQIRQLSQQIYPAAKAAGIAVLSSSGDSGPTDLMLDASSLFTRPVTVWPASDPLVTAVGGTQLGVDAKGARTGPDRAWGGAGAGGGGLSEVFLRPGFQISLTELSGTGRAVPDISLDAAPATGMLIYGSFNGAQWLPGGGTSHAAPLLAAIVALADQLAGARIGYLNDALYQLASTGDHGLASGIVDVTLGSNALTSPRTAVPGYPAVAGYDLATGLGTIDAATFVPAIVAATKDQHQPLANAVRGTTPASTAPVSPAPTTGFGNDVISRSDRGPWAVLIWIPIGLLVLGAGICYVGWRRRGRSAVR